MPHNTSSSTATVNGTQVDVAALEVIDFARLASGEPAEAEKLCKAARSPGFFYVDLRGKSTESYLACVEAMYPIIDKYFEQPHDVKMKDYRESEERGYKPGGFESTLEITRDEVVQGHSVVPSILKDDTQVIKHFITVSHHLSQIMLSTLSDELGIPFGESHRDNQPSATCLKLVYEPLVESSDIEENRHTDGGTLTILFGKQWATELQFPGTDKWAFIQPKEGYTLVNVGNSLQKLSGGKLHSCLHRFTQPAPQKRAYVMYFLRPETGKNLYGNC